MILQKLEKNKIAIAAVVIVAAFAALLYWILKDQNTDQEQKPPTDNLVEFEGSHLEEKKDGKIMWSLTAEKIQIDPDTKIIYVTHPKLIVADVDNQEMTVTADNGVVDRTKRTMEVKPPIKAVTTDNSTLQTDGSVYYNMDTHLISGGKVLMQKSDGTELSGDSFETTPSLNNVTLAGHAKVTKGEE